jgi:hypothetical protein
MLTSFRERPGCPLPVNPDDRPKTPRYFPAHKGFMRCHHSKPLFHSQPQTGHPSALKGSLKRGHTLSLVWRYKQQAVFRSASRRAITHCCPPPNPVLFFFFLNLRIITKDSKSS